MIFSESYNIPSYLCDRTDHLQLWGAARLLQEVAEHHTDLTHIGFHDLMQQGRAWVLCRMYYQISAMPAVNEKVILKTWSRGTDGLFALRDYSIEDEIGNYYVSATSNWAVIDFEKRRVCRLSNIMDNYEHHDQLATERQALGKLLASDVSNQDPQIVIPIQNSMLDHTNHVNNAEYVKWIIDQIPEDLVFHHIKSFEIDYITETHPGDAVRLFIQSNSSEINHQPKTPSTFCTESIADYFIQINNSRGVSALSRVIFA